MIALSVDFAAGRFHATPWDRSLHEGDIEWPPSPWRLLRAIVAAFYSRGHCDTTNLSKLCDRLASAPRFVLPPISAGHTRHQMPTAKPVMKSLILDAFETSAERRARAYIVWDDVTLSTDEFALLSRIVEAIGYLESSDSWCRIAIDTSPPEARDGLFTVDLASRQGTDDLGPAVRRLAPSADCRGQGLLAALSVTPATKRNSSSVIPAGATWLEYRFPPDFGRDQVAAIRMSKDARFPPRILRFRLEAPVDRVGYLPSVTETLVVGEVFRRAVLSTQGRRGAGHNTPLFTGKTAAGEALTGENHAYYMPRDCDGDGRIDTLDVFLPRPFSHDEYRALVSVSRLYDGATKFGSWDSLRVTFTGDAHLGKARRWRSATPFILPRFEKLRGVGENRRLLESPEDQIRRELAHRAFNPAEISVERGAEAVIAQGRERHARADSFRRVCERGGKSDGPAREAVTATLTFDEPVQGPIAIGRYAHFGLGQFAPIEDGA